MNKGRGRKPRFLKMFTVHDVKLFLSTEKCACGHSATERTDRRRLAMKSSPVHPLLWAGLLVLWSSGTEMCTYSTNMKAINPDFCVDANPYDLNVHSLSVPGHYVEEAVMNDDNNFLCVVYPTNILNCSWWFYALNKDAQLSASVSICNDATTIHSSDHSSVEPVGSVPLKLCEHEHELELVVLQFNISLYDRWTVYTYTYDRDMLEVLTPPQNISASFQDGNLLVTWSLPHSLEASKPVCFEYELDLGDQESPKHLQEQLFYKEPNTDQSRSYKVKIRTRQKDACHKHSQWSEWSQIATVEQSDKLSLLVIILICSGVPMILLALVLLVRYQRVSGLLFPPIPRPPQKYKCFLEKNDKFDFFHPAPSAEPEEEITEVEDTEQNPTKTS